MNWTVNVLHELFHLEMLSSVTEEVPAWGVLIPPEVSLLTSCWAWVNKQHLDVTLPDVPSSGEEHRKWCLLWRGLASKQTWMWRIRGAAKGMMWSFASFSKHFFRVVVVTTCNGGFWGSLNQWQTWNTMKQHPTPAWCPKGCVLLVPAACGTVSLLWLLQTSAQVKIAFYCRGVPIYCKSGEVKSNYFKVYLKTTRVHQSPVQLKRITHSRET